MKRKILGPDYDLHATLESRIDVGQGINIRPGKFRKKNKRGAQGYRDRYDIIDHGHEKNTFMCFFHRPIFTKIREFSTSVLWKLVVHFGYRGRNCTGVNIIS